MFPSADARRPGHERSGQGEGDAGKDEDEHLGSLHGQPRE